MKKIVIFIIVLILLITGGIFGYYKWNNEEKKIFQNKEVTLKNEDLKEDMFRVTCAKYGNFVDYVIGSVNNPEMESFVPITCMIEFSNYTDEDILVKSVEFDYKSFI